MKRLTILIFVLFPSLIFGQKSNDSIHKKRLHTVIAVSSLGTVASLTGLNYLWYADYPRSSFHFFNDNKEWMQMDKIGHAFTTYQTGCFGYSALRWAGVSESKAIWYGGAAGLTYLTVIEIMDGFSAGWGFSTGDYAANMGGAALFVSQQKLWKEQKISLKWSFQQTRYAKYRPDLLGENLIQQSLKDYNGQTYWMSFNLKSLFFEKQKFPAWLSLSIGHSADGMLGANENPFIWHGVQLPDFQRTREWYLAPDIDLSRIPVKNHALRIVLKTLSFLKFPSPALKINNGKMKILPIYF